MAELYRHTDEYGDALIFTLGDHGDIEATVSSSPDLDSPFVYLDRDASLRLLAALQQHYGTEGKAADA